jgi:hypothetical protein
VVDCIAYPAKDYHIYSFPHERICQGLASSTAIPVQEISNETRRPRPYISGTSMSASGPQEGDIEDSKRSPLGIQEMDEKTKSTLEDAENSSTMEGWRKRKEDAQAALKSIKALVSCKGVFDRRSLQELKKKLPPDWLTFKQSSLCGHTFCIKKAELHYNLELLESDILEYKDMSAAVPTAQGDPAAVPTAQQGDSQIADLNPALVASKAELVAFKAELLASNAKLLASNAKLNAKTIAFSAKNIASNAKAIAILAELIASSVKDVVREHACVKTLLSCLRKAANETYVSKGTCMRESLVDQVAEPLDDRTPKIMERSPAEVDKLLDNNYETLAMEKAFEPFGEEKNDRLQSFSVFLNKLVMSSSVISDEYTSDAYKKNIAETVKAVLNWDPSCVDLPSVAFPQPSAQEKRGVHPIVYSIMRTLASIINGRTNIIHEQYMLGCPCEVKPLERVGETFGKLVEQGINQVTANLSKIVIDAFEFVGIGADCTVIGVVLTMISVQVVELELSGMGSEHVTVKKKLSELLPLFDRDATKKLGGDFQVFGPSNVLLTSDSVQEPLPKGLELLCKVLMHPSSRYLESYLKSATCTDNATELGGSSSFKLKDFLGSGACASVYSVDGKSDLFMKVPKAGTTQYLNIELGALKQLSHDCIPKLGSANGSLSKLSVEAHCLSAQRDCLLLKGPIGMPARKALLELDGTMGVICTKVLEAMDYAHGKGWAHLDIHPSNIIVTKSCEVLLIDWGCAAKMENEIVGFRGCLTFAHDELLLRKDKSMKWAPMKKHDEASLAFTFACLSQAKSIPWDNFDSIGLASSVLDQRRDSARSILKDSTCNFQPGQVEVLLKMLGVPASEKLLKRPRADNGSTERKSPRKPTT